MGSTEVRRIMLQVFVLTLVLHLHSSLARSKHSEKRAALSRRLTVRRDPN